ncbi:hypothetical protein JCM10207_002977 [Rhodosporidiobolus poonsookiae]
MRSLSSRPQITVEWKVDGLKQFFGDQAAQAVRAYKQKQSPFIDQRWLIYMQLTTENPKFCGFYIIPRLLSHEQNPDGTWKRAGLYTQRFEDYMTIRCTISLPPYQSSAPLPLDPPPASEGLRSAYNLFFDKDGGADVRFTFPAHTKDSKRQLLANKAFLARRCGYFRSMFDGGFSEGASTDASRPAKRAKLESVSFGSPFPDDDDSTDWLPAELLEVEEDGEGAPAAMEEEEVVVDENEERDGMLTIEITDAGYITYRALLYYLHTEKITFPPPASEFLTTYPSLLADPLNAQLADIQPPLSRREVLLGLGLAQAQTQAPTPDAAREALVEPASPHAIYRLADKLGVQELKTKAKDAILKGFSVDTILYELVSTFSYHFDEIQQAALKYAWDNWPAVKLTPSVARVFAGAHAIEGGSAILAKLVVGLPTGEREEAGKKKEKEKGKRGRET